MLDIANDIRSLSDFKRNTSELLDRLKKTGNPLVLTVNGKAEVVVQDAEAYQELLERVETIEGIQRGLADVKAGRTKPVREVFNGLERAILSLEQLPKRCRIAPESFDPEQPVRVFNYGRSPHVYRVFFTID